MLEKIIFFQSRDIDYIDLIVTKTTNKITVIDFSWRIKSVLGLYRSKANVSMYYVM